MKLIIAGSRNINIGYADIFDHLPDDLSDVEIVSGMARGPDYVGYSLAVDYDLTYHKFPADWNKHGKKAGILRNIEMGDFADELLAFWDGKSRGTKHMIDYMTSLGKPVKVIEIGKTEI